VARNPKLSWPLLVKNAPNKLQGSVATCLRGGGIFSHKFFYKNTTESKGKRVLKIGQHFGQLPDKTTIAHF